MEVSNMAKYSGKRNLCLSIIIGVVLTFDWTQGNDSVSQETCKTFLGSCFVNFGDKLRCHTSRTVKGALCNTKDDEDLCQSFDSSLNCTLSVTTLDCGLSEGVLEAWIKGLRGVHSKLCDGKNSLVKSLIKRPNCFNTNSFMSCVDNIVEIPYPIDLLTTSIMDQEKCNLIMVSIAICIAKTEAKTTICIGSSAAVKQALITLFAESSCLSQNSSEIVSDHCESEAKVKTALAITLTIVVGVMLIVGLASYLMKKKIIIINKSIN